MLHKKKFGQHFLIDQNIINKLVNYINPTKEDSIIEIGPGDGALTKSIISKVDSMCLIEKDSDLVDELLFITNNYKKSKVINNDVLKFDFSNSKDSIRVIGNLPYNISTEIIFKMCNVKNLIDMHFMLQKEVVDRMISNSNTKIYGRLSVMTQAYFITKKLFDISEHVFMPKPKVKSSFIRLLPRVSIFNNKKHENMFYNVVKSAFEGRRKMIRTSLKKYLTIKDFSALDIKPELRAENLMVKDYLLISNYVDKN